MQNHYRTIFISDVHLGSKACKAELLCDFLKHNTSDTLYLVGDIIDGWRLSRKFYWPQSHSNVIRRILTASKRGTKVIYVIGNHDEVIRTVLPFARAFGNIELTNLHKHQGADGKTYLVIHGDLFDTVLQTKLKFLYHIGDFFYDLLVAINSVLAKVRAKFHRPYWSLSAYLKRRTKEAVSYLNNFEELIVEYCHNKKADGIICGHIHHADIKQVKDIAYMNDGDWVESCTALVEHADGRWEIIDWIKETYNVDINSNSVKSDRSL